MNSLGQTSPSGRSESSKRKTDVIGFNLRMGSKEQNKQNRNRLIDTEDKLRVARWEGAWGAEWKGGRIPKYKWQLPNSHGDVSGAQGTQSKREFHFIMCMDAVKSDFMEVKNL